MEGWGEGSCLCSSTWKGVDRGAVSIRLWMGELSLFVPMEGWGGGSCLYSSQWKGGEGVAVSIRPHGRVGAVSVRPQSPWKGGEGGAVSIRPRGRVQGGRGNRFYMCRYDEMPLPRPVHIHKVRNLASPSSTLAGETPHCSAIHVRVLKIQTVLHFNFS
jgi:hypothetical protein